MRRNSRGFATILVIYAVAGVAVVGTVGTMAYRLKSTQAQLAEANEAKADAIAETWKWKAVFDQEASAFQTLKGVADQCTSTVSAMQKSGQQLQKQVGDLSNTLTAMQDANDQKIADILKQNKPKSCDGATMATLSNYQRMAQQFSKGGLK